MAFLAKKKPFRIGFIGAGNMAEALIAAVIKTQICAPADVVVSSRGQKRLDHMAKIYSVTLAKDNNEVSKTCDVVMICVKPQVADSVLENLNVNNAALYVSVIGGYQLAHLRQYLGDCRCIRVMPNTPALVGACASAYTLGESCGEEDEQIVRNIMESCGVTHKVPDESLMDAVTGLAGSGPAYVYMMIEAMADAGVKNGLPRDLANGLAAQTVMGASKMVLEREMHPAVLRNQVESPGGTTIQGTTTLEQTGFRSAIIQAVTAATKRSQELGGGQPKVK